MTIEEMIEVMTAYKNGEKVQVASEGSELWTDDDCPVWDWNNFNYCIKPDSTPEGFEKAMRRIWDYKDDNAEEKHIKADKLMCNLLCKLGYGDGVAVFEFNEKWYA